MEVEAAKNAVLTKQREDLLREFEASRFRLKDEMESEAQSLAEAIAEEKVSQATSLISL